jgi:hypothetical protein
MCAENGLEGPNKLGQSRDPAGHRAVITMTLQRMRDRAETLKLGPFKWAEWRAYRDEGRHFG